MSQTATESPVAVAERHLASDLLDAALKLLGDSPAEIQTKLKELGWTGTNRTRGIEMYIRQFLRPRFGINGERVHYISDNMAMFYRPIDSLPAPIVEFLADSP